VSDVPETSLNLILSGLVATDDTSIAAAIIEHQGKQETYGIGDTIIGTRANLEQVLMDRVLIKQSGRLETLMLDGFDYNQPAKKVAQQPANKKPVNLAPNSRRSEVVDQRRNKQLADTVKNVRRELSSDPAKISDYLRISPKRKSGKIVGYSLRPGKSPEFFKLAGLKNGDVAVQMNGFDLIEPAQAMQAMAEMKKARDISLLVDRQGSLTEILVSLE
jgi:general secretion pathway protein C